MYALAPLLVRCRLRTLFICAIGLGIARYGLFAMDAKWPVLAGVILHGVCFTLFFIPAQIYIEHRIPKELRFRAQALMTLLVSGVGNLFGYLGCGALKAWCTSGTQTQWQLYWGTLGCALVPVAVYFKSAYRGGPAGAGELEQPAGKA
jgi:MFS family permease